MSDSTEYMYNLVDYSYYLSSLVVVIWSKKKSYRPSKEVGHQKTIVSKNPMFKLENDDDSLYSDPNSPATRSDD